MRVDALDFEMFQLAIEFDGSLPFEISCNDHTMVAVHLFEVFLEIAGLEQYLSVNKNELVRRHFGNDFCRVGQFAFYELDPDRDRMASYFSRQN